MEFTAPSSKGYTVYSKSACSFCKKVKQLLEIFDITPTVVDCDDYLIEDRDGFLEFIKGHAGKEYKTFPMVFADGKFLGCFAETKAFLDTKSE